MSKNARVVLSRCNQSGLDMHTLNREGARLPTLEDLPPVRGRRVLVRSDLNAPLRAKTEGGFEVADDFRLRSSVPTLEWLCENGALVTVCSHLGRPKGKADPRFSMVPIRESLSKMVPGITVMENLRFNPGEEANDPEFVRHLIDGFDYYVNDAFGACHRSHASIVGPPTLLPSAAGRLLQREVEALSRILIDPARPFVAVVGGAKVSDKLGVLRSLGERLDHLMLGGAMCFTFLAAGGHEIGASHLEPEFLEEAQALLDSQSALELPSDLIGLSPDGVLGIATPPTGVVREFGVDLLPGWQGVDIGPATRELRRDDQPRPHGPLERPYGRFRGPPVCRRYPRPRRSYRFLPRVHRSGWRRDRGGPPRLRSGRSYRSHLEWRRCHTRTPREGRSARSRCPSSEQVFPAQLGPNSGFHLAPPTVRCRTHFAGSHGVAEAPP